MWPPHVRDGVPVEHGVGGCRAWYDAASAGARAGDFIAPSGLKDGTGVAISQSDLRLEHLPMILGKAWSELDSEVDGFVTVAIGLQSTIPLGGIVGQQQVAIKGLEAELAAKDVAFQEIQAKLETLSSEVSKLRAIAQKVAQLEAVLRP